MRDRSTVIAGGSLRDRTSELYHICSLYLLLPTKTPNVGNPIVHGFAVASFPNFEPDVQTVLWLVFRSISTNSAISLFHSCDIGSWRYVDAIGHTVTRYPYLQWFTNSRLSPGEATVTTCDFEAGSPTNRSRVYS